MSKILLHNSRFWILATGVVLSANIAGCIELYIPGSTLQTIRIEQVFGFLSMGLLYIALLISPLSKVFPHIPGRAAYIHARRAIGVLAFYYALLHVFISFFGQLDGFAGLGHLDVRYRISLLGGTIALGILCIMAVTSLDWAVRVMHFKNWKLLHRLVYLAGITILVHVMILGPNYAHVDGVSVVTAIALIVLLSLEAVRIRRAWVNREPSKTEEAA